jgi:hypothetical protein
MKNILLAAIVLGLMSCSSQKKLEINNIPFEVSNSNFQKWSGGKEASGTGGELKIVISEEMQNTTIEKIYFRGRALYCELKTADNVSSIVASYTKNENANAISDTAGKKMQDTFELKPDQAIIAYKMDGEKLKYYKIAGIKEKEPILYRGRPKN